MLSRVTGLLRLPNRSRGGKDGGSNKRARSYDSGALGTNSPDSPTGTGPRKENAGSGQATSIGSDDGLVGAEADRPPLKEVSGGESARGGSGGGELAAVPPPPAQLSARQQEEKDFIRQNDTAEAQIWYLVDVQWLQEWKHFVTRNAPIPGPIDNSRLLDRATGGPRQGLRPVDDYRGVNAAIWAFWQARYGGGPAVRRRQLDLYSPPVREDDPSSPNSSEAGSSSQRLDMSLPGSAPAAPNPALQRSELARSSDNLGRSSGSAAKRAQEEKASPARGRSSQGKGRSSTASNRTASAPAKDRANVSDDDEPKKTPVCDKCDGPHETDNCPHFKRPREKHADAWTSYGKAKSGADSKEIVHVVRNARVVPQPADGSCLFHSLSYGLSDRSTASSLRREICRYVESNPETIIADTLLKDWIKYDSGGTVQSYAKRMEGGTWGGGIEMAALTKMKTVNVHVYEKCEDGYRRISSFDNPNAQKTISVLYQGRMHYDAIDIAAH